MASQFLEGIGAIVGKIANWIPSKREALISRREKIKNELSKLQSMPDFDHAKYAHLTYELREVQQKLDNANT